LETRFRHTDEKKTLQPRLEITEDAGVPSLRSIMPEKHDSARNVVLGKARAVRAR